MCLGCIYALARSCIEHPERRSRSAKPLWSGCGPIGPSRDSDHRGARPQRQEAQCLSSCCAGTPHSIRPVQGSRRFSACARTSQTDAPQPASKPSREHGTNEKVPFGRAPRSALELTNTTTRISATTNSDADCKTPWAGAALALVPRSTHVDATFWASLLVLFVEPCWQSVHLDQVKQLKPE